MADNYWCDKGRAMNTWIGANGPNNFSDPGNWSEGRVPLAGEWLLFPAGATPPLPDSCPIVEHQLTVGVADGYYSLLGAIVEGE